jgi:hypothetical protein
VNVNFSLIVPWYAMVTFTNELLLSSIHFIAYTIHNYFMQMSIFVQFTFIPFILFCFFLMSGVFFLCFSPLVLGGENQDGFFFLS